MTLDDTLQEPFAVSVEILNPETPFGGVQIFGASDTPIQVEFDPTRPPAGGGAGGVLVPVTTTLLAGDGLGGVAASGIMPASVAIRQPTYVTPTTINEVIACLRAAGLCA
jgi:hypothetical protein